jgi:hypothetical protein
MIRVLHEPDPGGPVDGPGEAVDLEGRGGHHGQHVTAARVHDHHGAGPALHGRFGRLLDAPVHGGHDLGPGTGLGLLDDAHGPAQHVHLDALAAVAASEVFVEQALETALAHHVTPPMAALPEVLLAGFPHVAQEMGGEAAGRVGALRLHLDDDAGQLEPPLLNLGHVLEAETPAHPHGMEGVGAHPAHRLGQLRERDVEQRRHPAQHGVTLLGLAGQLPRNQREREGGPVVDQRDAVAIEEDAPGRRRRADPDPVLVGGVQEVPALQHLQVPELAGDDAEGGQDDGGDDGDALLADVGAVEQRPRSGAGAELPPPHAALLLRRRSVQASASTQAAPRKPLYSA